MSERHSSYWLAPARNYRTSTRLHLQHFLAQRTLGRILDPELEKYVCETSAQEGLVRIADLACGNGAWLKDLHSELSKKKEEGVLSAAFELHGLDINPVYFPNETYLPPSIALKELDILAQPLPAEMVGAYDVVHVRAFVSIVAEVGLAPLLSAAMALLKPGGLLRWEESRNDAYVVESPAPAISKTACLGVAAILTAMAESRPVRADWVDAMDRRLAEHGFEGSRMDVTEYRREDFKAWTENFLAWWSELDMLFPTREEQPDVPMTRDAWLDLYTRAIKEVEEGVVVHMGSIRSAVGRKPM